MINVNLSKSNISKSVLCAMALTLVSFHSSARTYTNPYDKLLNECTKAIVAEGYTGKLQLFKNIYSGTRYKFWINIGDPKDPAAANNARAYCEGKTLKAEIEKFGVGAGSWVRNLLSFETQKLLETQNGK